jgi:MFS family permease
MPTPAPSNPQHSPHQVSTWQILGYVYFTFISYMSIGLPLAVLPPYVHLQMGYSAMVAGLVVSMQYVATLASRPWAGRISDRVGAKVAVEWGMACCTLSGGLLIAAGALLSHHWIGFLILILSRLTLGIGESLGSTGSTLWGITAAGPENTARVIGFNGVSTYGAMAIAAPLGVVLDQAWGLWSLGLFTVLLGGVSLIMASRKADLPVTPGKHLPFVNVMGKVAPHGMALALGGVCYSVLATFITLFYANHHWTGAALCLTSFGVGFIFVRLFLIWTINRYGGFPMAIASLSVVAVGMFLLWQSLHPSMAITGAFFAGFGFSLVFPSIGVEAVKRVDEPNRGTALGVYTAFSDVSFFLVGPVAGAIIGAFGYASVFLFALVSVLVSLGIVIVLRHNDQKIS